MTDPKRVHHSKLMLQGRNVGVADDGTIDIQISTPIIDEALEKEFILGNDITPTLTGDFEEDMQAGHQELANSVIDMPELALEDYGIENGEQQMTEEEYENIVKLTNMVAIGDDGEPLPEQLAEQIIGEPDSAEDLAEWDDHEVDEDIVASNKTEVATPRPVILKSYNFNATCVNTTTYANANCVNGTIVINGTAPASVYASIATYDDNSDVSTLDLDDEYDRYDDDEGYYFDDEYDFDEDEDWYDEEEDWYDAEDGAMTPTEAIVSISAVGEALQFTVDANGVTVALPVSIQTSTPSATAASTIAVDATAPTPVNKDYIANGLPGLNAATSTTTTFITSTTTVPASTATPSSVPSSTTATNVPGTVSLDVEGSPIRRPIPHALKVPTDSKSLLKHGMRPPKVFPPGWANDFFKPIHLPGWSGQGEELGGEWTVGREGRGGFRDVKTRGRGEILDVLDLPVNTGGELVDGQVQGLE
jgi:hypothetical protein